MCAPSRAEALVEPSWIRGRGGEYNFPFWFVSSGCSFCKSNSVACLYVVKAITLNHTNCIKGWRIARKGIFHFWHLLKFLEDCMAQCPARFESRCRLKLRADFNPQHAWASSPLVFVTVSIDKTNSEHYQLTSPASISSPEKSSEHASFIRRRETRASVSDIWWPLCASAISLSLTGTKCNLQSWSVPSVSLRRLYLIYCIILSHLFSLAGDISIFSDDSYTVCAYKYRHIQIDVALVFIWKGVRNHDSELVWIDLKMGSV